MFSLSQRIQTLSNQALTFACFIVVFVIATSWLQLIQQHAFMTPSSIDNIKTSINLRTSRYYGSMNGKPKENSKILFDLNTDLSPLFNWNTKQVFVYLTGEYEGQLRPQTKSEVTYWDKIITKGDNAKLQLKNVRSKYAVWDLEEVFVGRELTFKLKWNMQPWIGPLIYGEANGNKTITITSGKPANVKNEKKSSA